MDSHEKPKSLYDQLVDNLETKHAEESDAQRFKIKTLNQQEADQLNSLTYNRYIESFEKEVETDQKITKAFANTTISSDLPEKFQLATIQKSAPGIQLNDINPISLLDQATIIKPKKRKKKKKKKKKKRKKRKREEKVGEKKEPSEPAKKKRKVDEADSSLNLVSMDYEK